MSSTTVVDHSSKRKSGKKSEPTRGIDLEGMMIIPFIPRLAQQIGVNDALLLVQIDYWLHNLRFKVEEFEGMKWLNLSAAEMHERGFEHIDRRNINATILRLVQRDLLRVAYLPGSRTKWLTPNYELLKTYGIKINSAVVSTNWDERSQNQAEIHQSEHKMPLQQDETSQNQDETSQNLGRKISANEMKQPTTPLYIKDPRDQGKKEERKDQRAAEPPRMAEQPTVTPPPSFSTPQKEISVNQKTEPASDPKLDKLMEAIAEACRMNLKLSWHRKEIEPIAQELLQAGYAPSHMERHSFWWQNNDWRGKKGDIPKLRELAETLHQSAPYVGTDLYYNPDDDTLATLEREADSECPFCGGFGWSEGFDPRYPVWGDCICTDPNFKRQHRHKRA